MTAPSIARVGYKDVAFTFALARPAVVPSSQKSIYLPVDNVKPLHPDAWLCVLPPRPAEPTSADWTALVERASYLLRRARLRPYLQARKARGVSHA
jgi:hypothetical protein